MAAMYLTEKRALGTERAVSDHEEVEILLEGFARQLEETANNIQVCVCVCVCVCVQDVTTVREQQERLSAAP
jgi:hypothetical protein